MPDKIIAQTSTGAVRGRRHSAGGWAFLGIPYGGDTSGARRFRPPVPATPWRGVRDAHSFGPHCPQEEATAPVEDAHSITGLGSESSEDCLVLNVWTPSCTGSEPSQRPVMVWLHGGGFRVGSASHPVIDGANLSSYGDVVIVSVNHRLNLFGYLFLDDLAGAGMTETANVGLCDLVLALQWVRDNIAAFGGDAGNVTVFGQSGGGRKVSVLMAMPSARGLFHRAIIESGAHPRCIPREKAARFASGLLRHAGLAPTDLRTMPAEQLLRLTTTYIRSICDPALAATADAAGWMLSPLVDGEVVPSDPWGSTAPETSRDVPLMIGTNKDEAALHLARQRDAGQLSETGMQERCRAVFGDQAESVIAAHRAGHPLATPWELMVAIASEDRRMLSIEMAEKKARQNAAPAYMYFFTWESNEGFYRAAHTMEIPFVFRTLDTTPIVGTRQDRHDLSDAMSDAWIAFARTGQPSHAGLPDWRPYTADARETMLFDTPPGLVADPWRGERLAWGDTIAPMPWETMSFVSKIRTL